MRSSAELVSPSRVAPLELVRARQWAHFVALPLAGFDRAAGWGRLPLGCAVAALSLAYAYGVNAISDRATDLDAEKNPLVGRRVLPASAAATIVACAAAALALAAAAGPFVLAAAGISLLAATVYSVGPRWKAMPALGTLLNAAIFAPLLLFAAAPGARAPGLAVELTAFAALLLQNQLLHEQADAAEDAAAGTRSTALWLGPRGVRVAAASFAMAAAVCAALASPTRTAAATAVVALVAGTAVALGDAPPRARRVAHRWIAFVGGALLFAATRLA